VQSTHTWHFIHFRSHLITQSESIKMTRGEETNRITLRLPESILKKLRKESDEKILPLNAIINRILTKHVMFDMRINKLSGITTPQDLLSNIIDKLDETQKRNLRNKDHKL